MNLTSVVVVVGTTSDYIDYILKNYPGRSLFVTDPAQRLMAKQPVPEKKDELLCSLKNKNVLLNRLKAHLAQWNLLPVGITCFDCESLLLASFLAKELKLPFPSYESISLARNKFLSKEIWRKRGVLCPIAQIVVNIDDAIDFYEKIQKPVILKPSLGTGGELVFKCADVKSLAASFDILQSHLKIQGNYDETYCGMPREAVIEEYIHGEEYSCDFVLTNRKASIIRTAKKWPAFNQALGGTGAYLVPGDPYHQIQPEKLSGILTEAALALELESAICMVDFIVKGNEVYLLEMTPRPGGDCLPDLIKQSCGLDMLKLALDVAEGLCFSIPRKDGWQNMVGLRVMGEKEGVISSIEDGSLKEDHRVRLWHLKSRAGNRIKLPPNDYDSRVLGDIIFAPYDNEAIEDQCLSLINKVKITVEDACKDV